MLSLEDPEVLKVVRQVAQKLAEKFWWVDEDDLVQEAASLCLETKLLENSTSYGALHQRLLQRLIDTQKTQSDRERRFHTTSLDQLRDNDIDVDTNGALVEDGRQRRSRAVEITGERNKMLDTGRSRLLDALATKDHEEFVAWADQKLGRSYGKKADMRTLLYGSSQERRNLWTKYAQSKRRGNSGITRVEDWDARYRWAADPRSRNIHQRPLVVSVDGDEVVVAAMLRKPLR